MYTLRG